MVEWSEAFGFYAGHSGVVGSSSTYGMGVCVRQLQFKQIKQLHVNRSMNVKTEI